MPEEKGHYTKKEILKGVAVAGAIEGLGLLSGGGPASLLENAAISAIAGYTIAGRSRLKRERKEFEKEKKLSEVF